MKKRVRIIMSCSRREQFHLKHTKPYSMHL